MTQLSELLRGTCWRGSGQAVAVILAVSVMTLVTPASRASDVLAEQLARGGYNIFWRHAHVGTGSDIIRYTLDEAEFTACEKQRNLDAKGRTEAHDVGAAMAARGIKVSEVVASPYCRTRESAELAFGVERVKLDPLVGTVCEASGAAFDRHTARLRELLSEVPPAGGVRVVVSHNCNIRALASMLSERCAREPQMGDAVVFRPASPAGSGFEFVECLPLARMRTWLAAP